MLLFLRVIRLSFQQQLTYRAALLSGLAANFFFALLRAALLTTHDLSDVEPLCERVMILDHGRLLYDGALAELNRRFESDWSLVVTLEDGAPAGVDLSLPGLPAPQREGSQVTYRFDHRKTAAPELIQQLLPRLPVADIEVRRPAVEETMRRIYEEKLLVR